MAILANLARVCEIDGMGIRDGAAVLDGAVAGQARKGTRTPGRASGAAVLRRDLGDDFAPRRRSLGPVGATVADDEDYAPRRRAGGLHLRLNAGIPRSVVGRVLAGGALLAALAGEITGTEAEYAGSIQDAIAAVVARAKSGDLVITQGAGNVSSIAPMLLEALETAADESHSSR